MLKKLLDNDSKRLRNLIFELQDTKSQRMIYLADNVVYYDQKLRKEIRLGKIPYREGIEVEQIETSEPFDALDADVLSKSRNYRLFRKYSEEDSKVSKEFSALQELERKLLNKTLSISDVNHLLEIENKQFSDILSVILITACIFIAMLMYCKFGH